MRYIVIAEALENGAKVSAIALNNARNVPSSGSECANAVRYAVNFAVSGCVCDDGKSVKRGVKGAQ